MPLLLTSMLRRSVWRSLEIYKSPSGTTSTPGKMRNKLIIITSKYCVRMKPHYFKVCSLWLRLGSLAKEQLVVGNTTFLEFDFDASFD